ncbi:hypothetical protein PO498_23880 [Klebsiella variicola]|nr:hypothetical protein [Klebsiella variicola]
MTDIRLPPPGTTLTLKALVTLIHALDISRLTRQILQRVREHAPGP